MVEIYTGKSCIKTRPLVVKQIDLEQIFVMPYLSLGKND
jgi:hypothetical protein